MQMSNKWKTFLNALSRYGIHVISQGRNIICMKDIKRKSTKKVTVVKIRRKYKQDFCHYGTDADPSYIRVKTVTKKKHCNARTHCQQERKMGPKSAKFSAQYKMLGNRFTENHFHRLETVLKKDLKVYFLLSGC